MKVGRSLRPLRSSIPSSGATGEPGSLVGWASLSSTHPTRSHILSTMSKLVINIDGGSRGNPGPAAYGCYLQPEGKPPIELKGKLGTTTNNVAEYHGLIRALEKAVELGADEVHIRADSELLVRQMLGVYRVKN